MNNSVTLKGTKEIVITAVFIAMTFVATMCINIRLPIAANGGLIHLGNVPLFVGSIIFGRKVGMYAGALGMGLFDLFSGWTVWAPFTFIICGAIGFAVGKIADGDFTILKYVLAILAALLIKIVGYYIAEIIITGNLLTPINSVWGNIIQIVVAGIITLPILTVIKKYIGRI